VTASELFVQTGTTRPCGLRRGERHRVVSVPGGDAAAFGAAVNKSIDRVLWGLLLSIASVVIAATGPAVAGTTVTPPATFTYDAPSISRTGAHAGEAPTPS
jgi:hypothetical protein